MRKLFSLSICLILTLGLSTCRDTSREKEPEPPPPGPPPLSLSTVANSAVVLLSSDGLYSAVLEDISIEIVPGSPASSIYKMSQVSGKGAQTVGVTTASALGEGINVLSPLTFHFKMDSTAQVTPRLIGVTPYGEGIISWEQSDSAAARVELVEFAKGLDQAKTILQNRIGSGKLGWPAYDQEYPVAYEHSSDQLLFLEKIAGELQADFKRRVIAGGEEAVSEYKVPYFYSDGCSRQGRYMRLMSGKVGNVIDLATGKLLGIYENVEGLELFRHPEGEIYVLLKEKQSGAYKLQKMEVPDEEASGAPEVAGSFGGDGIDEEAEGAACRDVGFLSNGELAYSYKYVSEEQIGIAIGVIAGDEVKPIKVTALPTAYQLDEGPVQVDLYTRVVARAKNTYLVEHESCAFFEVPQVANSLALNCAGLGGVTTAWTITAVADDDTSQSVISSASPMHFVAYDEASSSILIEQSVAGTPRIVMYDELGSKLGMLPKTESLDEKFNFYGKHGQRIFTKTRIDSAGEYELGIIDLRKLAAPAAGVELLLKGTAANLDAAYSVIGQFKGEVESGYVVDDLRERPADKAVTEDTTPEPEPEPEPEENGDEPAPPGPDEIPGEDPFAMIEEEGAPPEIAPEDTELEETIPEPIGEISTAQLTLEALNFDEANPAMFKFFWGGVAVAHAANEVDISGMTLARPVIQIDLPIKYNSVSLQLSCDETLTESTLKEWAADLMLKQPKETKEVYTYELFISFNIGAGPWGKTESCTITASAGDETISQAIKIVWPTTLW